MRCVSCGRMLAEYRVRRNVVYCDHICQHADQYPAEVAERVAQAVVVPPAPAPIPDVVALAQASLPMYVQHALADAPTAVHVPAPLPVLRIEKPSERRSPVVPPPAVTPPATAPVPPAPRIKPPHRSRLAGKSYVPVPHTGRAIATSPGYVYVMYSPNRTLYKIGLSVDVYQRVKSIRSDILDPAVRVLFFVKTPNMLKCERSLHCLFAEKRVDGEWFRLAKADLDLVQQVGPVFRPHWSDGDEGRYSLAAEDSL